MKCAARSPTSLAAAAQRRNRDIDVAAEFDHLLDVLALKRNELQRWANELDLTVAARTVELEQANTQLREAQRQLVMREKLSAIGELTAGVAHEINNPIAVILGNATSTSCATCSGRRRNR